MKPSPKQTSPDVDRSGNLAGRLSERLVASDTSEEEKDDELVAAATERRSRKKQKHSTAAGAPPKRTKAAAVQRKSPPSASLPKSNPRKNARHIPLFPIPESIGVATGKGEEEDYVEMDSSSSSEEYGEPHEDDDLEVMWPSVVQAGARLSEARTWTARPTQYNSRKRPRGGDEDTHAPPLIQHYNPRSTALTALKERMRTFVTEALLPVAGEEESAQMPNSLSVHSSGNSTSTLDFAEGCHRRLVEAIFEIGMSHASPAVIMEHMIFPTTDWLDDSGHRMESIVEQVTSERVKSHLQKYRKNKHKSKEEFLREYDRWTQKALMVVGGISAAARTNLAIAPTAVLHMMGHSTGGAEDASSSKSSTAEPSYRLLGGDLPAYLTFSVMLEEERNKILREEGGIPTAAALQRRSSHSTESSTARATDTGGTIATQQATSLPSAQEYAQSMSGARVLLPILSEEERQSSLGISISHVVGLFYSMSHALMKERKKEQQKSKTTDAANAPPRTEFRPVEESALEHAEPESHTAKGSTGMIKPASSSSSTTAETQQHSHHPRSSSNYFAASAATTSAAAEDPDPERRRGPADDERYATEHMYAYGQHHSSYESSHYHHTGGSHPPYPLPPPPRYPPPHYSNLPPSTDGPPPPPYNNPTHRGGHYGL